MRKNGLLGIVVAFTLASCGFFEPAPDETTVAASAAFNANDPLATRASYLAGGTEYAYLTTGELLGATAGVEELKNVALERRYDGYILRGRAMASTMGHHSPVLVRDPEAYDKDPANPVYVVRLLPPEFPTARGQEINREVLFGGFISARNAEGIRSVILASVGNRVTLRLR